MWNRIEPLLWRCDPFRWKDERVRLGIDRVCAGYSSRRHWEAFRRIFAENPTIRKVCVLGVYCGRDIAYMCQLLSETGRDFSIVGVDLFADVPGADWPSEKSGLGWEEAGFGPAPKLEKARSNLEVLGFADRVRLVQSSMQDYLARTGEQFDLVYIDVSHDYETTCTAIRLGSRVSSGGLLAGDDFSDQGTWGVARAVRELCPGYELHHGWIWSARNPGDLRGATEAPRSQPEPGRRRR